MLFQGNNSRWRCFVFSPTAIFTPSTIISKLKRYIYYLIPCLIGILSTNTEAFDRLILNHNDNQMIISDPGNHRFLLYNLEKRTLIEFKGTLTGGKRIQWSVDDRFIAFKAVQEYKNGSHYQTAIVFDLDQDTFTPLKRTQPLLGSPVWGPDDSIFFIEKNFLYELNVLNEIFDRYDINCFTDWIDISNDGTKCLFIGKNEQLFMLNMMNRKLIQLTDSQEAFCRPQWSPDDSKALFQSISGTLYIYDFQNNIIIQLDTCIYPYWIPNSSKIIGCEPVWVNDRIEYHRIVLYSLNRPKTILLDDPHFDPCSPIATSDNTNLYFIDRHTNSIYNFIFNDIKITAGQKIELPNEIITKEIPSFLVKSDKSKNRLERGIHYIPGVPYIHQVYCTPYHFDGRWACNGTAAVMAISYYDILSDWDFIATTPFSHTSHFGNYISEIYTYNGYTFNIGSPDASDNLAYGAYGYIVQNDWEDTKEHMGEFISYHNLDSPFVDWNPTWEKLQGEIDQQTPFVLLSSITSAGHYLTTVGYYTSQHTLYLNDPYGNKNEGYMNFNGAGVSYDWPGYNNGYENLNTVWCFIYARGTPPQATPGTIDNPIEIDQFPFTDINTTRSSAGTDMFNYYSCAPSVDERGREITYHFITNNSGVLDVSVTCDNEVDIDIHLLSSPDSDNCLARAHISFSEWIPSGEYWIICDTYKNASGIELMGDYQLDCDFQADPTPTPTATPPSVPSCSSINLILMMFFLSFSLIHHFPKHWGK